MQTQREYVSCADTAKLLRAALKSAFPSIKFGVRSKSYAGGASITVSWDDGPRSSAVQRVCDRYSGADFDGMQDLKTYHDTILVGPTGMRRVHFGADYIFTNRHESPGTSAAVRASFARSLVGWDALPEHERDRLTWRAVSRCDLPMEPDAIVADYFANGHRDN